MDLIETVNDQDRLIAENSIRYLNSLTQVKALNVPTLQSLFRTKCRLLELRRRIFLPVKSSEKCKRCQKCFIDFSERTPKYEVRPIKFTPFAKTVINKVKKNIPLTSYQRIYYKKIFKKYPNGFQSQNKLVVTCSFCNKETEVLIKKPQRKKRKAKLKIPIKKKKPKKKDKLCGLNESVVKSSTKKKSTKCQMDKMTNNENSKDSVVNESRLNTTLTTRGTFETADFIPLQMGSTAKRKFKLSKTKENTLVPAVPPIVTKIDKKLQKKKLDNLANVLKKAKENKNGKMSKLKQFLESL